MKRFTLRMDDYVHQKFKLFAKKYHRSLNSTIIELAQIGYIVKERNDFIEKG